MDTLKPIRTEQDLHAALKAIEPYFDSPPDPGSAEADHYDILSALIEHYEARHIPVAGLDPVETIMTYMEDEMLAQADLAHIIGSRSRASEILSRKRPLTMANIRAIASAWQLPVEDLIAPYDLAA